MTVVNREHPDEEPIAWFEGDLHQRGEYGEYVTFEPNGSNYFGPGLRNYFQIHYFRQMGDKNFVQYSLDLGSRGSLSNSPTDKMINFKASE